MEVWFTSFSFLFMVDGCRFQPLICQGVPFIGVPCPWESLESPLGLAGRKGEALAAANSAVGLRGRAGPSLPGWGRVKPRAKGEFETVGQFPRELRVSHPKGSWEN